jgi:hypothetical protein
MKWILVTPLGIIDIALVVFIAEIVAGIARTVKANPST